MTRVEYSPRAREDLADIWNFSAGRWDEVQADTYITEIIEACEALARGDRVGRSASDIRAGYFRYPVGSHVIYFQRRESSIVVGRILHGRMDAVRYLDD